MPLSLRFVPPSKRGKKEYCGKKKVPSLWTACAVTRRKDLSIFPYIPLPSVSGANVVSILDFSIVPLLGVKHDEQ